MLSRLPAIRGLGLAAACTLLASVPGPASAHGSLEARLERLAAEIAETPDDPRLLLRRAQLYRLGGRFADAHADLDRAARISPGHAEIDYHRGRLLLDQGDPDAAELVLGRLLAAEPGHVAGLLARARVLRALGRLVEASGVYTQAIDRTADPTPDPYLERARALADAGPEHLSAALAGLDEGIEALGPLPALTRSAVELELRAGRSEAALARVEREMARSPQPVWWHERKAQILDGEARYAEARDAYGVALRLLQAQPPGRRRAPAWRALEERLTRALSRLTPGPVEHGSGAGAPDAS